MVFITNSSPSGRNVAFISIKKNNFCTKVSYKNPVRRARVVYTVRPDQEVSSEKKEKKNDLVSPDKIEEPYNSEEIPDLSANTESLEEMDPELRMTRIIIDIVNAGSSIENILEKYYRYLDEALLERFYKRIEAAKIYEEDKGVIDGLIQIWCYVRAVVERKNASPAAKLIDACLNIVDGSTGEKEKYQLALDQISIGLGGMQQSHLNIFKIASDLAEGYEPPNNIVQDHVPKEEFLAEAQNTLIEGKQTYEKWVRNLEALRNDLQCAEENSHEESALRYKVEKCEEYVDGIKQSLENIKYFINYAESL